MKLRAKLAVDILFFSRLLVLVSLPELFVSKLNQCVYATFKDECLFSLSSLHIPSAVYRVSVAFATLEMQV